MRPSSLSFLQDSPFFSSHRLRIGVVICALSLPVVGCTTTESAKKEDPSATDPSATDPSTADDPATGAVTEPEATESSATNPAATSTEAAPANMPPAATPAVTPPAKTEETPATGAPPATKPETTARKDTIDDETPIPAAGAAAETFRAAVDLSASDPKAAITKFEEAGRASPKFYAAWFNAGAAAERINDVAAAERNYRKAIEVRPDYGPALANLYLLLKKKGNASGANAIVDSALRSFPRRAGPHLAAAMRAYSDKDFSKTKQEALAAIRIDERTVAAMRLMGAVFRAERRYETAKFALENALILEPGNALLYLDLGHVKLALEDEKGARESFEKAVKLRPNLAEAQEQYGILMERYGDPDRAVAAFRKTTELRPTSGEAHLHLGNGLRAQKKYADAEAAYRKALELNSGLHLAHFNLGVLYMDNSIEGRDKLEQMNKATEALTTFANNASPTTATQSRVDDYQNTLKRRIKREKKRRKRDAERKAIEEEEKKKESSAGTAGEPAAGEPAAGEPAADGDKIGEGNP